jgi:hypothetical protein
MTTTTEDCTADLDLRIKMIFIKLFFTTFFKVIIIFEATGFFENLRWPNPRTIAKFNQVLVTLAFGPPVFR